MTSAMAYRAGWSGPAPSAREPVPAGLGRDQRMVAVPDGQKKAVLPPAGQIGKSAERELFRRNAVAADAAAAEHERGVVEKRERAGGNTVPPAVPERTRSGSSIRSSTCGSSSGAFSRIRTRGGMRSEDGSFGMRGPERCFRVRIHIDPGRCTRADRCGCLRRGCPGGSGHGRDPGRPEGLPSRYRFMVRLIFRIRSRNRVFRFPEVGLREDHAQCGRTVTDGFFHFRPVGRIGRELITGHNGPGIQVQTGARRQNPRSGHCLWLISCMAYPQKRKQFRFQYNTVLPRCACCSTLFGVKF